MGSIIRPWILVVILTVVGLVRIGLTYPVYNNTFDEPAHLTAGIDWLEDGSYPRNTLHPPLARTLIGIAPYIAGVRSVTGDPMEKERGTLYQEGRYWRNLTLARIGILPFFLLAVWVVWKWSVRLQGHGAGLLAVFLFTNLPPVLGHAGLATTDMGACATVGAALFAWTCWLDDPGKRNSILLGLAIGLACLTKISAVLFLPAGGAVILVLRGVSRSGASNVSPRRFALSVSILFLVIWGGYRFSLEPLTTPEERPHDPIHRVFGGTSTLHDLSYRVAEAPIVPAASFFRSMNMARALNEQGFAAYLLGDRLEGNGVWYFFPVVLGVKTPLAFLALLLLGFVFSVKKTVQRRDWRPLAPALAGMAILIVCLPSDVALGVRHVLPVYLLFAISAGVTWGVFFGTRLSLRILGVGLLAWHFWAAASSHPDYLPYFNELAATHPEHVLVESDLDWGQDLHRLADALDEEAVPFLNIAYFGTADLDQAGLPPFRRLSPGEEAWGWIAVSRTLLKLRPGYAWLDQRTPERVVGKSIELHLVPERNP